MSSFTSPLRVEIGSHKSHGRLVATVLEPFEFYSGMMTIIVPSKFETDFASVPRLFWVIAPPFGPYAKAAVVHDYLCFEKYLPRRIVDNIFLEGMLVLGVNPILAKAMWAAVRLNSIVKRIK